VILEVSRCDEWSSSSSSSSPFSSSPADVAEAVEPGLRVLAGPRGVEASLARLVEERRVVIVPVRLVQLHVHHAAGRAVALTVLLLLLPERMERGGGKSAR